MRGQGGGEGGRGGAGREEPCTGASGVDRMGTSSTCWCQSSSTQPRHALAFSCGMYVSGGQSSHRSPRKSENGWNVPGVHRTQYSHSPPL